MKSIRSSTELEITRRCKSQDLDSDVETSVEDLVLDHEVVDKFVRLRTVQPEGLETIRSISGDHAIYSLHAGRFRGATWHDRNQNVCWLLALGIHKEGNRDDAYELFKHLSDSGMLMPVADDYEALFRRRNARLVPALIQDALALLEQARSAPGEEYSALLAGVLPASISVDVVPASPRAIGDEVGLEEIWLTLSSQVRKGWLAPLLAGLAPREPQGWQYTSNAYDARPLRGDQLGFRHCHDMEPLDTSG